MDLDTLTFKKEALDKVRPLPRDLVENLARWLRVELTYTSNSIEGNTLTRQETALVLEQGITIGGKTLNEHFEAKNHADALDYINDIATTSPAITEEHFLRLHHFILSNIDSAHAGIYRQSNVRIAGSSVIFPAYEKVPHLMQEFFKWFAQHQTIHPVLLASESHYRLVTIHPFVDGNGRAARLFMNLLLLRFGYPPGIIGPTDRLKYIKALEGAQLGGSLESFHHLVYRVVGASLNVYLDAASGKQPKATGKLYKIAEFARISAISVPTLRHWINIGLISPAEVTPSGYSLFSNEQIKIIKEIQKCQEKRLSLSEIKLKIEKNI